MLSFSLSDIRLGFFHLSDKFRLICRFSRIDTLIDLLFNTFKAGYDIGEHLLYIPIRAPGRERGLAHASDRIGNCPPPNNFTPYVFPTFDPAATL